MSKMEKGTALLIDIYQALYGPEIKMAHLNELASDLSQIAGRGRPWTGKFLHSLIKGYPGFTTNGHLSRALAILADRLAGYDEVEALAQEAQVKTLHQLPTGTIILGQARRCATPCCQVYFVPTHPRQKYHSQACARASRRRRRRPGRNDFL